MPYHRGRYSQDKHQRAPWRSTVTLKSSSGGGELAFFDDSSVGGEIRSRYCCGRQSQPSWLAIKLSLLGRLFEPIFCQGSLCHERYKLVFQPVTVNFVERRDSVDNELPAGDCGLTSIARQAGSCRSRERSQDGQLLPRPIQWKMAGWRCLKKLRQRLHHQHLHGETPRRYIVCDLSASKTQRQ